MNHEIILASTSLNRAEILSRIKVIYSNLPSNFEEQTELLQGESYEDLVRRLALGKARKVASRTKNAIVIGADSFAVFNGAILGKPKTRVRAIEYLTRLSGRTHDFYTGMAIIDTNTKKEVVDCSTARVHFKTLAPRDIEEYVDKEEILSAAGAYRIQGLGATLIDKIEGDYFAVVGLSPSKLQEMFKSLGHNLFDYVEPSR